MEIIGTPILLKAVDFLFGEASKILQERRERRKSESKPSDKADVKTKELQKVETTDALIVDSKQDVLNLDVNETMWLESKSKVENLMSLLEIYLKNYYLAKEQYAKWGSALVPPIIKHNMEEAENEIENIISELKTILSNVYGKNISIPDLEQ